jgi:hypothetical protein
MPGGFSLSAAMNTGSIAEKGPLLLTRQPPELAVKAGEPLERRHGYPF